MRYGHIFRYVTNTPWAILESKMADMLEVLTYREQGHRFTAEEIQSRIGDPQAPAASKSGFLAVIPLRGVIAHRMGAMDESSGGMSAERFTSMVKQATADDSIGTILLDIDSPGGSIPGLMEAADAVYAARATKRVVAIANGTMASAAYWIGSQAHEIVAIPSALDQSIGSIGVFAVLLDMTEKMAKDGVKATIVRSGVNKNVINPFEPLSDEALARMQAGADAAKVEFIKAVSRGRGIPPAQVKKQYGDGLAFSAPDAKEAGLVDRVDTMENTVSRLLSRKAGGLGMRAEDDAPELAAELTAADAARAVSEDFSRRLRLL